MEPSFSRLAAFISKPLTNMRDGTYHRDIGLPAGAANIFCGTFRLNLTLHAVRAASEDRYGIPRLNRQITIKAAEVVEVTYEAGRPIKAVVRLGYSGTLDVVLVVFPPEIGTQSILAKTLW